MLASDEILALFAALLRIAQIEGGARRAGFAPVDLAELLHHAARHVRAGGGRCPASAGAFGRRKARVIRGDRELLVQLFSNLIENAIVHTPAGTSIEVALSAEEGTAIVTRQR